MPYTSLIRRLGTNAYAAAPTASTVEAAIRSMTAPTGRSAIDEWIWRSRSTVAWVAAPLRANMDETDLLVVITEQGENRNPREE